jgi:hypothetical protein
MCRMAYALPFPPSTVVSGAFSAESPSRWAGSITLCCSAARSAGQWHSLLDSSLDWSVMRGTAVEGTFGAACMGCSVRTGTAVHDAIFTAPGC